MASQSARNYLYCPRRIRVTVLSMPTNTDCDVCHRKRRVLINYSRCLRAVSTDAAFFISSAVPVVAPTVHVDPLTATSLLIFWNELEPHEARGIIVQYKIFYRKQDAGTPVEITVPGTVLQHNLTGNLHDFPQKQSRQKQSCS